VGVIASERDRQGLGRNVRLAGVNSVADRFKTFPDQGSQLRDGLSASMDFEFLQ
jgi:hypothetical protein